MAFTCFTMNFDNMRRKEPDMVSPCLTVNFGWVAYQSPARASAVVGEVRFQYKTEPDTVFSCSSVSPETRRHVSARNGIICLAVELSSRNMSVSGAVAPCLAVSTCSGRRTAEREIPGGRSRILRRQLVILLLGGASLTTSSVRSL